MTVVPLSVFFLDTEREAAAAAAGDNVLYGFRRGGTLATAKSRKKPKGKQPTGRGKAAGSRTAAGGQVTGGGEKEADHATAGTSGQSTASQTPQESATMATGTPLISPGGSTMAASFPGGASKLGATRATTGATGSGNVAQYPVPLSTQVLRRTSRKRRKKKKQESRDLWIQRLGQLMQS